MNKGYKEREAYNKKEKEVKVPDKDVVQKKGGSGKLADKIPTPQGSNGH